MHRNEIKTYITLLLVFISLSGFTQTKAFKQHIGIGIHGGMLISNVRFDPADKRNPPNYESISTYSGGLIVNIMAEKHAGLQIEANISNRGWEQSKDSVYTYKRDMRYLEIPVLTHLTFGKRRLKYVFNLGPYVAFHQKTHESFEIFNKHLVIAEGDSIGALGQAINQEIDLGFMFDGGIGIQTSIGVFQVKARYSQGVLNIFDKYPDGLYRYSQMQNFYFGLSYCYNFYFRERD